MWMCIFVKVIAVNVEWKWLRIQKKKRTRCWNWAEDAVFIYHPKMKTSWQGISYMLTNANKHIHTYTASLPLLDSAQLLSPLPKKMLSVSVSMPLPRVDAYVTSHFLKPGLLWFFLCQLLTNYNTMCLFVCLIFFFLLVQWQVKKDTRHVLLQSAFTPLELVYSEYGVYFLEKNKD